MDEFALIRNYFADLTPLPADIPLGIGDDAALLAPPADFELAISTDTLIAGRHFPERTAAADIGWKALAVNLSDLAAMGAEPWAFTLALSLPAAEPDWLREFAAGLGALARQAGIALVGGDTTRGPLTITLTVLGRVPKGQALRRTAAQAGDVICVSGTLGDGALGLRLLDDPSADARWLVERLNRPQPRLDAGRALRGIAHAAIDVSDGLGGDLSHILKASGVGADVNVAQLPTSTAFRNKVHADQQLELQLRGGDDYELCVCMPPAQLAQAKAACAPVELNAIGMISAEPGLRLRAASGAIIALDTTGYRHFS